MKAVIACKKIIQVKPLNVINSKNSLLPADCSKGKSLQKRKSSQPGIVGHIDLLKTLFFLHTIN